MFRHCEEVTLETVIECLEDPPDTFICAHCETGVGSKSLVFSNVFRHFIIKERTNKSLSYTNFKSAEAALVWYNNI